MDEMVHKDHVVIQESKESVFMVFQDKREIKETRNAKL